MFGYNSDIENNISSKINHYSGEIKISNKMKLKMIIKEIIYIYINNIKFFNSVFINLFKYFN